jgi:hypothetical protein
MNQQLAPRLSHLLLHPSVFSDNLQYSDFPVIQIFTSIVRLYDTLCFFFYVNLSGRRRAPRFGRHLWGLIYSMFI